MTGLIVSDGRFPDVFTTVSVIGSGVGVGPGEGVISVSPPVLPVGTVGDGTGVVGRGGGGGQSFGQLR